jgi:hypothetical protein
LDDFPCKFPVIREISHSEHSSLWTASTAKSSLYIYGIYVDDSIKPQGSDVLEFSDEGEIRVVFGAKYPRNASWAFP